MTPRILFCSQSAEFGEAATWLEDVAAALRDGGWEVIVALARGRFHDPARYRQRLSPALIEEIDGSLGFREQRYLRLIELFERTRPDIIVPVHLADALYAAAEWKRLGAQTRLVTCVHTAEDEDIVGDLQACENFIDLAAAESRRLTELLRETLQLQPDRVVSIPIGVPPPLHPSPERDRIKNLLHIARFDHAQTRLLDLIRVAHLLEREALTFHIVGSGPDEAEFRERLEAEVQRGAFFFYGALTRAELYERIYPAVDALLVFSERESDAIPALEAMTHGVVPIVSDFTGRAEAHVIRDRQTGRVFPVGDVQKAANIVREYRKPGSLAALSKKCRNSLPHAYRFDEFRRRWNEELSRVLKLEIRTDSTARLPRPVSPGWLARFGLGPKGTLRLRKLLRRRGNPTAPALEWPERYATRRAR